MALEFRREYAPSPSDLDASNLTHRYLWAPAGDLFTKLVRRNLHQKTIDRLAQAQISQSLTNCVPTVTLEPVGVRIAAPD
jgi:hypothetical protein